MELPRVVVSRELQTLDVDGRPCEVCGDRMYNHAWALLDTQGFVLFCSNIRELEEEASERRFTYTYWWNDGESETVFSAGGRCTEEERRQHVIDRARDEVGQISEGFTKVRSQASSCRYITYRCDRRVEARFGNWEEVSDNAGQEAPEA